MTGYEISRQWFDWVFENPEKAKPSHTAIYFWMIEMCNRLGWKKKFGLPTLVAMDATGIKSKNTYYKAFNDLIDWNFIEIIEKSKNQNTANIISICAVSKIKSVDKSALDSAVIQHSSQREFSGGNIDKPENQENKKPENGEKPRAFQFLKNKYPSLFEQKFQIVHAKKIKENTDPTDFANSFSNKVEIEGLEFTPEKLFPRLDNYAINWIKNDEKEKKKKRKFEGEYVKAEPRT